MNAKDICYFCYMKNIMTLTYCLFLCLLSGSALPAAAQTYRFENAARLLEGKKAGLLINNTSVVTDKQINLADALLAEGIDVKKIFAPEHGFRGTEEAGENVKHGKDAKTGLPIISLYGKNHKPTAEQMKGIDVLVFDIQDAGARFFTYISSMYYAMEACAENDVEFIVLDRANPCDYIDGPVLKREYKSFVGMLPIPVLHGLTVGELALMINGEGWLESNPDTCRLQVVKAEGWRHGQPYSLPIKPSPNLPNDQSVSLYASLCFFEATPFSIGRGTRFPFQVIGYPDKKFGSFTFTPAALKGLDSNPLQKDKVCYGTDLRTYPFEGGLSLRFILEYYKKTGNNPSFFFSRPNWFDLLAGTKKLRTQIIQGLTEDEIRASWQEELNTYKEMRKKYLLYPDYN